MFFGDERQVPLDDDRSNYANARCDLLDLVPIPHGQIHPLTDADQYEGLLRAFFGERCDFDVLLLGMGDDGHTASLFPGSDLAVRGGAVGDRAAGRGRTGWPG